MATLLFFEYGDLVIHDADDAGRKCLADGKIAASDRLVLETPSSLSGRLQLLLDDCLERGILKMVAFPLFELITSPRQSREQTGLLAARLVEAALSELTQIEGFDQSLAPADPLHVDHGTMDLLRGMYEKWAREADLLITQLARVEERLGEVPAANALRDAHGRTCAMLSISLRDIEKARGQIAEGKLIDVEEVRRGLRLKVH